MNSFITKRWDTFLREESFGDPKKSWFHISHTRLTAHFHGRLSPIVKQQVLMLEPDIAWMTWTGWRSTLPVKRAIAVPFPTGAQGGHYFPNLTTHSGVVWYLPLHAKTFSRSALTSPCSSSLAPLTHLCSPHHFFRDTWEYRNRNGTNWYWSAQNLWHFSKKKNKNKTINQ